MNLLYFGAFFLCVLHVVAGQDAVNADVVNNRVQRTVDLTTHLPKVNSRITLENTGKIAVRFYIVAIDPNLANNVSFVGASVRSTISNLQAVLARRRSLLGSYCFLCFSAVQSYYRYSVLKPKLDCCHFLANFHLLLWFGVVD